MEDYLEIDLKKIIRTLFAKWLWILGFTLAVGVVVFLFFFLKPDTFESRATVALIQPQYEAVFASSIITKDTTMPAEALIKNTALSNEIVPKLFSEWSAPNKDKTPLESFVKNQLSVLLEGNGAVVTLSAKSDTLEEAAKLTNLWASLLTSQLNSAYYGMDESQVTYFEAQLEQAKIARDKSSDAIVKFEETDISNYLEIQLADIDACVADMIQKKTVLE